MATILGCFIGWERRNADRPAGIRTMALVSLGSCLFSICSAFAFLSGELNIRPPLDAVFRYFFTFCGNEAYS